MGFRDDLPTMVGAFSRFSGSATMSVCCSSRRENGGQEKAPPLQGLPGPSVSRLSPGGRTPKLEGNGPDYLAKVRDVVVVMVNDSRFLLIELDPTLTAQLSKRVTCTDPTHAWLGPYRWALGQAALLPCHPGDPPSTSHPQGPATSPGCAQPSWTAGQQQGFLPAGQGSEPAGQVVRDHLAFSAHKCTKPATEANS